MKEHVYTPPYPLSESIAVFWHYEGQSFVHEKEQLMPAGTSELVINLREDSLSTYDRNDVKLEQRYRGCLLCGPHSRPLVIDTTSQEAIMGVHFRPGGAYAFFGVPLAELHNGLLSLQELWGDVGTTMHERLVLAGNANSRFALLERYLLEMKRRFAMTPRHAAVRYALQAMKAPVIPAIRDLEGEVGLSARRFIALFRREVGMTPKRYARLCRFQQALISLSGRAGRQRSRADVALSCGYYDQAHLNRDFRDFAGLTPSDYAASFQQHPNHVALPNT